MVHFGLGNFHRAHQAMYLDRLMNDGQALDWAICGVGVMPGDTRMRDAMHEQDNLYTLVLKHTDGYIERRIVGSIAEYLYAPDDPQAVIERLSDPATRIVSLTVTEGGYNIDHLSGRFDLTNPRIAYDLAHPDTPVTVFGLVVAALRRRREDGTLPFTIMSCDNVQSNGEVAKRSFLAFAAAVDPGLAAWMQDEVSFPSSMVDRITPATTDADRALVRDRFGIPDDWPVVAEPFAQWVLEDNFPAGRPPFQDAGVQLVDHVEPYELMKLRLLNASHQAMAYFGALLGYKYAHEAAADPLIRRLLQRYMDEEATPTLRPVPGIDLEQYKATLLERFANPEIRDTLERLCTDASDRIPVFLLPVVRENLEANRSVALSAAIVASWARFAEGTDIRGEKHTLVDPLAQQLAAAARRQRRRPLAFLEQPTVFGDLVDDYAFTAPFLEALTTIHADGVRAALQRIVGAS
ncbi:mannitol 2-dehydrogenase [Microbacterium sp. BE35]|uniref:mannitol dehydrogenase family protein n=1 Tax=Microbacterium sp. BE35 TaxID=2817773 RepID=UPI00286702D3|nr:mannitol dehydrogenase family protein [Microbacterium sp. BE35]MDR7188211.1 mannitol 2-dehydrogenase [Microbacterium sp. BE35]